MLKQSFLYHQHRKGFTLLEVMIAVTIMAVGLVAALSLIATTVATGSADVQRLIAVNLAQEGIELVRNIRDSNWADEKDWDKNLGSNTNRRMDYQDDKLKGGCQQALKIDGSGFYAYGGGGDNTAFTRCIDINNNGTKIEIISLVEWTERGRDHTIKITNYLYEWQ